MYITAPLLEKWKQLLFKPQHSLTKQDSPHFSCFVQSTHTNSHPSSQFLPLWLHRCSGLCVRFYISSPSCLHVLVCVPPSTPFNYKVLECLLNTQWVFNKCIWLINANYSIVPGKQIEETDITMRTLNFASETKVCLFLQHSCSQKTTFHSHINMWYVANEHLNSLMPFSEIPSVHRLTQLSKWVI